MIRLAETLNSSGTSDARTLARRVRHLLRGEVQFVPHKSFRKMPARSEKIILASRESPIDSRGSQTPEGSACPSGADVRSNAAFAR